MPPREHTNFGFTPEPVITPAPVAPTWNQVWTDAFTMENDVYNAYKYLTRPTFPDDPTFPLVEKLRDSKYPEEYFSNFLGVRSQPEFDFVSAQIEEEEASRQRLGAAGWGGIAAMTAMGMLSPTAAIPFVAGGRGMLAIARAAAAGAAVGAAQEVPLQMQQATRTGLESAAAIGGSAVVSGILGGAVSMLRKGEMEALERGMADTQWVSPISGSIEDTAAAGAQVVKRDPGLPIAGARTLLRVLDSNPVTRSPVTDTLNQTDFKTSRIAMAQIADAGLAMQRNAVGGTAENNVTVWYGRYADWIPDLDSNYNNYVFDGKPPSVGANIRAQIRAYQDTTKLSKSQFREEVSRAMWQGDVHENKFVEATAKAARKKIYDVVLDAMKKAGVLKDNVQTNADYINWVPNHEKIMANPQGFVDFLEKKYSAKLNEEFADAWDKHVLKNMRDEEFLTDARRSDDDIRRLRDELGAQLKDVEKRLEEEGFNELKDQIDAVRAAARSMRSANPPDTVGRNKLLADARAMEEAAGPAYANLRQGRREIRRRLSQLNKAKVVLEERLENKLSKIERAEELSEAGLMRVARKGQKILNEIENWSDERLDKELSELKSEFARVAKIYDKGEERIASVLGERIIKPMRGKEEYEIGGGKIPEKGLVVANTSGNKVYIGEPGQVHHHLYDRYGALSTEDPKAMQGFMNPEGQILNREEALAWVQANERNMTPSATMGQKLDALDYDEKVPMRARRNRAVTIDDQLLGLDQLQQTRADKLTNLTERIADAEDLGRDAVRDMLQDMLNATITRVRQINDRRAVRTARLRAATADLAPEVVDQRLAAREAKLGERKADFWQKQEQLGAKVDPVANKADFTTYAREAAHKTKDKFLGTMLRLPVVDMMQAERGAALPRLLSFIPTEEMAPWLERDIEKLIRIHLRTMAPDIELAKRFGGIDMPELWLPMQEELAAKLDAVRTAPKLNKKGEPVVDAEGNPVLKFATPEAQSKESVRLQNEFEQQKRNLEVVIRRLRNLEGLPSNPDGMGFRMGKVASDLNVLRMMGGVLLQSIPDLGKPIMRYGLGRVLRDGFMPYINNLKQVKMTKREASLAGVGLEVRLATRANAMHDVLDDMGRGTKFERGLDYLSRRQGVVALFSAWTDEMKAITSAVANGKILDSIGRVVEGKASKKEIDFLAQNGIDAEGVDMIWKEVVTHGGGQRVNGHWLPNTEDWRNPEAVQRFRAAVAREVNNTIVTPGVERPAWTTANTTGRLISQFKSFAFASTYRTLAAGMQQRDAAFMQGVAVQLGIGALSYYLYAKARGGDTETEMNNAGWERWADEAYQRSGLLGTIGLAQDFASRIPAASPYVTLSNRRTTRRGGDDLLDTAAGPTYGDLLPKIATLLTTIHDPTQATVHLLRQLVPYQNYTYITRGFDAMERAIPVRE